MDSFNTEKKETLICEFHFRPSEIVLKAGSSRKSLVEGAVPSTVNFKNAVKKQIARKSPKKRAFTEVAVDSAPNIEEITDKGAKGGMRTVKYVGERQQKFPVVTVKRYLRK